jgi:hypothetical protein
MKPSTKLHSALFAAALLIIQPCYAQVPQHLNYQGRVSVQGVNFAGNGEFKFALVGPEEDTSSQATAMPVIGGLGDGMGPRVLSINVLNGGSGYTTAPTVTITHPTGTGATATAVVTDGVVTSIVVNTNGLGYDFPPTNTLVTIDAPPENLQRPTRWSNDGTSIMGSQPAEPVSIPVTNGLYSVALGDTDLPNMNMFPENLFADHGELYLRVWFNDGTNDFQLLSPDQRLLTAPYSMFAATIPDGSITSQKIASGAVGTDQIANGAVGAGQLANGIVDSAKLAAGAISPPSLNTGLTPPAPGQVLSFTNEGLRWVNSAAGLALPFSSGPISVFAQPVFSVEATAGSSSGIYGASLQGDGVRGQSSSVSGAGVYGSNFSGGRGVEGVGSGDGSGVYGSGAFLTNAIGVKGHSFNNDGVVGETGASTKAGVFGNSTVGNGVAGFSSGAGKSGVFGFTGEAATYGGSFSNSHANGIALKAFGKTDLDGPLVVHGTATVEVLTITGGADLAEPFAMSHENVEPGSVVIIDDENPGKLRLSHDSYDRKVAGIVSGADGIRPGISMIQEDMLEAGENVALSGRVYVKANNSAGNIQPGDLLTTSAIPGEAMKASDHDRAQGAILGKAMTSLSEKSGKVLVLVTLQ